MRCDLLSWEQVCTEWQTAMTMISICTHALQMLVEMVDLLAEEAEEPSAACIWASVKDFI
jgi:hypothetical protein